MTITSISPASNLTVLTVTTGRTPPLKFLVLKNETRSSVFLLLGSVFISHTEKSFDSSTPLSLTIVATNELHDFNHVLGCNYEKDLHL